MLSQRFATKYVIKQFEKLISPFSTQIKIDDILTTYLKLDNNTIETLHEYEKKSKITKISKNSLVRNCITLRDFDIRLERNEYLLECLMLDPKLLRNRILVLKEVGIDSVDLSHIRRFSALMHKSVYQFKKLHAISSSQSIMRTLFSNVGVKVDIPDQEMLKNESGMRIGSYYQLCAVYHKIYHMKLHDELFYKQKRMKYLSLTEMSRTLDVLQHKCQFDIEFNFEIPHESINTTVMGLKMRKDTFLRRYISIENNLELAVWLKHPRILFMIYFYKLVMNRFAYIKHLNLTNNANINTYLSDKEFFSRFLEGDTFTVKGKYLAYILRKELGHDKVHVLSSIKRHVHWKYISLTRINETIQYLKKHFSIDDICKNIQIILYPMSTIDNTLNLLYKECSLQDGYNYTPTQYLALCVYKLEQKHHFNGDGVWQVEIKTTSKLQT
ncbi:mitochondrial transcription termination factor 5 isoform X3 [Bombus vancouverensis nearcticus]|uniref:mitochondrial transcription termination factor 5 isoform X3 n=1 Tax=Bombus vancouverensis nearcticus TaxID=2705178 RepID=UPI00402B357B